MNIQMSVPVAKGLAGRNLWALLLSSGYIRCFLSIYHMVGDVLGIEASLVYLI